LGPGEIWRLDQRVVILDAQGRERLGRTLPATFHDLARTDLDGDGRVDLLFQHSDRLRATRGDLQDLWSWPALLPPRQILPARPGHPAAVVLNAMMGLDGATGRPRWWGGPSTVILDPGDATNLPRLLGGPEGTTACRVALPTTPEGVILPARGEPAQPSLARDDPRWERPLPWATAISSNPQPQTYLSVAGLALLNVVVPLAILRLATRRRRGSLPLLMALPVAVAVPVAGFLFRFKSLWPPRDDDPSAWVADRTFALTSLAGHPGTAPAQDDRFLLAVFALTSLAGLPVLVYLTAAVMTLVRRRWGRLALLIGLTVVVGVMIGLVWLGMDRQSTLALEHYTWSGWYEVAMPAAYVVGLLALVEWLARGLSRLVRGRRRGKPAAPLLSS
jgi:hypothetical protein